MKRLGSSFFFQRAKSAVMTTHNLWQKVAVDLARQYPSIRRSLITMLRTNDINFTTQSIEDVFCMLIQEPLRGNGKHQTKAPPVIVIDALDECGGLDGMNSEHREKLMQTLKLWSRMPKSFKLIVTSRSESDLEDTFLEMAHHLIEIIAGQMATSSSSKDIHCFLQFQLCSISISPRYRGTLPPDWPGTLVIKELTEKAGGLFIWARTVIEFIKGGIPQKRLNQILEQRGVSGLADLYLQILKISFPNPDEEVTQNFQSIVGTIILARRPLSASSIGHLLSIDEEVLKYIFTGLQSVLEWGGEVIQFHHQSFVDFVLDENRCPAKFLVSQESRGRQLALACLKMMKKELQFNICRLQSSHLKNKDMVDLDNQLKIYVPTHLSYSCCFWMDHLTNIKCDQEIYKGLEDFINMQFLYWLEVLSVMKQVGLAHKVLTMLAKWMRDNSRDDVATRDMRNFVGMFATCISESTPHIYLSALPFSPRNCWVSRQYLGQYPGRLILESGGHKEWPVTQNVLVGHKDGVTCVAFSLDGHHIVSGSHDTTIRVWNAETGQMTAGPFQGHTDWVTSVSFSPDGHHIVSGSHDTTIQVWNAETGQMTAGPFQVHRGAVSSVSFSPDGHHVVSGSHGTTIQVWNPEPGLNQVSLLTFVYDPPQLIH
ncbi:hypothetical protein CPB86DRAFT_850075 [Serendipita vermifera]|nr:hypothetical protein CPB86DRAFT_850075 [Serendipita vermifera]